MSVETAKRTRTRMRKVECDDCGTILYGSAAALRGGLPTCACGGPFVVPNLADLELIDPDAFERVVDSLGEREHNGLMRVLGYDHAIATTNKRSIGTRQCKRRGCKALRADPLGDFCQAHADEEAMPF